MGCPQHPHPFLVQRPCWMEVPMTRSRVKCVVDAAEFCLADLVNDQPTGIISPNHRSAVFNGPVAVVRALCPIETSVMAPRLQVRTGGSRPVEGAGRDRLWF